MSRALSIASYVILAFGFLYLSFHVGRAFETGRLGEVARVPGHEYRALINEAHEEK